MIAFILLTTLLALPSSSAMDSGSAACPSIPERPALVCTATKHGWFYASSPEAAAQAADDGTEAIAAFRRYFGQQAPFGAVVLVNDFPQAAQDQFSARHSLDYLRLWIPPESRAAMLEESIRKSMPNLPDSQVQEIVQRVGHGGGRALRHEMGHSLYQAVFWPQHPADAARYATPAPDWLDEASAILLEPEDMLTERRAHFRDLLRQGSTSILPLGEFLTTPHPLATAGQRAQLAAQGSQTSTGIIMAARSGEAAVELSAFYLQSLAVADFLIERSGKQDLLGDISLALVSERTFEAWLAEHGGPHQLGTDLAELDQLWSAWLDSQR